MDFKRRHLGTDRRRQRRFLRPIVTIVIVIVLIVGWYQHALSPVDQTSDARVTITVAAGVSVLSIAQDLRAHDLIRSTQAFAWHARFTHQDRFVRAGTYVLRPSMSVDQVLQILTGGAQGELSITIPEGFTIADIDRLMAARGFTDTGAIITCAKFCTFSAFSFLPSANNVPGGRIEGYTYPDTYFVGGEARNPEQFLGRLIATFHANVSQGLRAEIQASGRSLHEIVTMASLIEEEAANDAERPVIAGILWKRLDEGMILGVDAAVRYAVSKPAREPLTQADLASDSAYNLRRKQGLPPGPITNPGLASMKAALNPEVTPYYYYLHGSDGSIHYAVTNEEHNRNRAQYLP